MYFSSTCRTYFLKMCSASTSTKKLPIFYSKSTQKSCWLPDTTCSSSFCSIVRLDTNFTAFRWFGISFDNCSKLIHPSFWAC